MHIIGKLINFYIDLSYNNIIYIDFSYSNKLSNIENVSRVIGGVLINPPLKCFEIFLIFHGLLLSFQKKILMKISLKRFQESLEKNSWEPIAMLCTSLEFTNFLDSPTNDIL